MNNKHLFSFYSVLFFIPMVMFAQLPSSMRIDVGNYSLSMDKLMGEGGLQTQFSWMLTGADRENTEIFYWPADRWKSNMLYQIFNPIVLDTNGILNADSVRRSMYINSGSDALINSGKTDWMSETRRYRPPVITVNGVQVNPQYEWHVDPTLKSDIKIEFEDVLNQFGIRSHVEIYAFSNPGHGDYFIWKATHKFTGELEVPRDATTSKDTIPDQTIKLWWPLAFSFGPSKAGEMAVMGTFAYEGIDDLDSWFKRKSELLPAAARESLYVAYYWDSKDPSTSVYPSSGSKDDTGDPDRTTGFLHSTQICGYTLLHADKSYDDKMDDVSQPYSMPHAGINKDMWGRRDEGLKLTYRGDDARGRFPLDPITAKLTTRPEYGPMRFITVGPYELTKNSALGRYDSMTFVYAVGAGSIGWNEADSIGRAWYNKEISDSVKNAWVLKGRDSLWKTLDRANWAWDRLSKGFSIPSPPPPPDVDVIGERDSIVVSWSYPDSSYFKDYNSGVDDWHAWRVYRKQQTLLVNDPIDWKNGDRWEIVHETTKRSETWYVDRNVKKGMEYFYAVTAIDDGLQNTDVNSFGEPLESSRFVTRTLQPVMPTGVEDASGNSLPASISLRQNYPNPFNPTTEIRYTVPTSGFTTLKIYDLLGREIATVLNEQKSPGTYMVHFDAHNLPSGVYFYRLTQDNISITRSMIVLR